MPSSWSSLSSTEIKVQTIHLAIIDALVLLHFIMIRKDSSPVFGVGGGITSTLKLLLDAVGGSLCSLGSSVLGGAGVLAHGIGSLLSIAGA